MFSQKEIDKFHQDGFIIARNVIQGQELATLQQAASRVTSDGIAANDVTNHLYYDQLDGSRTYFRSERMWDRDPIFQAVTVNPTLLSLYGQLIGHPFMPIVDSFVCKLPFGNVPVRWHQDPPFGALTWLETHPIPNIDADIYLDHSTIDNGCVWAIPEHHLVGHVRLENFSDEQLFTKMGAKPIELGPGDVSFHCLSAPHGSRGNQSASLRRTFYIHFMNQSVLDECYRHLPYIDELEAERGLFDERAILTSRKMIELRENLGYKGLEESQIHLTNEGFEFTGDPRTPPRHWKQLIEMMSQEEIEQKRALTYQR